MRFRSKWLRLPALLSVAVIAVTGFVVSLFAKRADRKQPTTLERLDKAADGSMPSAGCNADWGDSGGK